MNLDSIGTTFGTDKSSREHDYLNIYEKFFIDTYDKKHIILEIGVQGGRSLRMWDKYFVHKDSKIYGIENCSPSAYNCGRIKTFVGSQEDRVFLKKTMADIESLVNDICPTSVIIDDGGHTMAQQQISLGCLFQFLKSGGLYIIEDLHTSYHDNVKTFNETGTKFTTLDMLKRFCDERKIYSDFITSSEAKYIEDMASECIIEKAKMSEICFIRKK